MVKLDEWKCEFRLGDRVRVVRVIPKKNKHEIQAPKKTIGKRGKVNEILGKSYNHDYKVMVNGTFRYYHKEELKYEA